MDTLLAAAVLLAFTTPCHELAWLASAGLFRSPYPGALFSTTAWLLYKIPWCSVYFLVLYVRVCPVPPGLTYGTVYLLYVCPGVAHSGTYVNVVNVIITEGHS